MLTYTRAMPSKSVIVWDLPTRVFHWALVLLVALSWWTGEAGGTALKYHFWSGYTILSLLLFRLIWGTVGGEHSRFAAFVRGPRHVWQCVRELRRRDGAHYLGHNPLGGWMVLLLLSVLLLQAGSGLFANDDLFNEGPLYAHVSKTVSDRLTGLHKANFVVIAVLVAVHVAAIGYHWAYRRENLVRPMLTGRKPAPTGAGGNGERHPRGWLAALSMLIAAGVVAWVVNL
jgi:cytochrome b